MKTIKPAEDIVLDAVERLNKREMKPAKSRTAEKRERTTNRNKIAQVIAANTTYKAIADDDVSGHMEATEHPRKVIHHEKKAYYSHAIFWNNVHALKSSKKTDATQPAQPTVIEMTGKKVNILSGVKNTVRRLFNRKSS